MQEKKRISSQPVLFNAPEAKANNMIGKKLLVERKGQKLTLNEISMKLKEYGLNMPVASLSKWENGVRVPNAYQLLAVSAVLGIEDTVSLFTGNQVLNDEGRRRLAEYRKDLIDSGNYRPEPVTRKIKYIQMPVSFFAASAGTGNFLDDENFEMMNFPEQSVPTGADFAVKVSGDSMEPVYADGQFVWVKKCTELMPGEVGIFTLDDSGYIKVYDEQEPEDVEAYTDGDGAVHMQPVLISYNEKYNPIVVGNEQRLVTVGRVL